MRSFKTVGQLVEKLQTGKTPPSKNPEFFGGDVDWFTPTDLDKEMYLGQSSRTITKLAVSKKKVNLVPKGTLLLGCIGNVGKIGITTRNSASNQQITGLIPKEEVDVKYLYYWFKGHQEYVASYANKAVVPILNNRILSSIKVPYFKIEKQRQIAHQLDLIDRLRQSLRAEVAAYDALGEAVFLEMFGDVFSVKAKYKHLKLGEVSERIQIGPFGAQLHKHDYIEGGVPVINPMHLSGGKILAQSAFSITKDKWSTLPQYHLDEGDVIMGRRGEMGRCAIVQKMQEGYLCGTGSLFIRPNKKILSSGFLQFALSSQSGVKYLENEAKGVTMMNLNKTILKKLPFALPSLPLQHQFATRIRAIEALRAQTESALSEADQLFGAVMAKVFG